MAMREGLRQASETGSWSAYYCTRSCTNSSLRHSRARSRQSLIKPAPAPSAVVPPAQFCPAQGHRAPANGVIELSLSWTGKSAPTSPLPLPTFPSSAPTTRWWTSCAGRLRRGIAPDRGAQGDAVWMLRLPVHPVQERMEVSTSHGHHLHQPPFPLTAHTGQPCTSYLTCGNAGRAGWAVLSTGRAALLPTPLLPSWYFGEALFYSSAGPGLVDGATAQGNGATRAPNYAGAAGLPENLLEPCDGRAGRAPPAGLRMLGSWVLGSGRGALGSGRAACEVYIGT
jgi:hypothetical protein